MKSKIKGYHYTECGLPNVWIDGLRKKEDVRKEVIRIPKIGSLHKLIATAIVTSKGTLTGAELRYLRTEMGLNQTQMGALTHRERVTVSRWECEENTPDGASEAFIRILAACKLGLGRIDPEQVSGWCSPTLKRKRPVRITATAAGNYRLVA